MVLVYCEDNSLVVYFRMYWDHGFIARCSLNVPKLLCPYCLSGLEGALCAVRVHVFGWFLFAMEAAINRFISIEIEILQQIGLVYVFSGSAQCDDDFNKLWIKMGCYVKRKWFATLNISSSFSESTMLK